MKKPLIKLVSLALLIAGQVASAYTIHYTFTNSSNAKDVTLHEAVVRGVTKSPGDIFIPASSHKTWAIEVPEKSSQFVYQVSVSAIDVKGQQDQGEVCRFTDQVDAENPYGINMNADLGILGRIAMGAACSNHNYVIEPSNSYTNSDNSSRYVDIQFDDPSSWAQVVNSFVDSWANSWGEKDAQ